MDTHKQKVGKLGESEAAKYLQSKGFSVVCRNYWRKWGEIDLVVQKAGELRFVEVKAVTRTAMPGPISDDYEPEDNIHPWKRKRLRRIIETYLASESVSDDIDWQVDVITAYLHPDGRLLGIEQLEDVVI